MTKQPEGSPEEMKRLQRCINDLVGILALPAIWTGAEASQIVGTLSDSLLLMLQLDLIFVRVRGSSGEAPDPIVRFAQTWEPTPQPQELAEVIDHWLGSDSQKWPAAIRKSFRGREICLVPLRLGLHGEFGAVVAGSQRVDFPQQTEKLLLSVAANQAAIGLQESTSRSAQRQVASHLNQLVVQRTAELAATNEELMKAVDVDTETRPVLTQVEIDRARPYGRVRQVELGEILYRPGEVGSAVLHSLIRQLGNRSANDPRRTAGHQSYARNVHRRGGHDRRTANRSAGPSYASRRNPGASARRASHSCGARCRFE